jgi:hypothetical protein
MMLFGSRAEGSVGDDSGAASFEALVEYNPYAVQNRYETLEPDDEPLEPARAVARVGALLERVARHIAETEVGVRTHPALSSPPHADLRRGSGNAHLRPRTTE